MFCRDCISVQIQLHYKKQITTKAELEKRDFMEYNSRELLKQQFPFWSHLNEEEKKTLTACSTIQDFKKGAPIQNESQHCIGVFLVLKGHVRVYIQSEEGREITLLRINSGEVCTLSASCMMAEISFEIMMESIEDSTLLISGRSCLRRLMNDNLYIENYIYRHLAEHFSDVMWAMSEILFKSFDRRLAGYLEDEKINRKTTTILATHDEIARDLGSAREVVSRMLKYFEREGIVSLSRGSVQIINDERLRALSY